MPLRREVIEQYCGLLGVDEGAIVGERQTLKVAANTAIPATQDGLCVAAITLPIMSARDALLLEVVSGDIGTTDASGELTLLSLIVGLRLNSSTIPVQFNLPVFGQVGPIGKAALLNQISWYATVPNAQRLKDLFTNAELTAAGTVPAPVVEIQATVRNNDGAAPHTVIVRLVVVSRVISGVQV
jgi:hypothetical protein